MTQSETQERLKQIRERQRNRKTSKWDSHGRSMIADVDTLLSLIDTRAPVDSQGAESEWQQGIQTAIESCRDVTTLGRFAAAVDPVGWVEELQAHLEDTAKITPDAATQMRTACVEKAGEILRGLMIELSQTSDSYLRGQGWNSALARATNEIVPALSSLTLDQVKQK